MNTLMPKYIKSQDAKHVVVNHSLLIHKNYSLKNKKLINLNKIEFEIEFNTKTKYVQL